MKKHIALIGLRATGKSTIGPLLADRLGRTYVDLDKAPVKVAGLNSIIEVIRTKGKEWLSQTEHEILKERLASDQVSVVATGGRTISHEFPELKAQNRLLLKEHATVILLSASDKTMWRRILKDREISHSHLDERKLRANFETGLEQLDLYKDLADVVVEADQRSVEETVDAIVEALDT